MPVLDHLVYATPDLAATAASLTERLGIASVAGGHHPGLGTRNQLYGLGNSTYLEIIGPDESQDVPPQWFGIAALTRPRLVGWAARTGRIDLVVAGSRERGYDPGDPVPMARDRADGTRVTWRLTMPKSTLVPFLIDWGSTPHPAAGDVPEVTLESLVGEHPEPLEVRQTLGALGVALPLRRAPHTRLTAVVAGPGGRVELA